eukprot:jgi/Mesvir1/26077/Mv06801-RA.1
MQSLLLSCDPTDGLRPVAMEECSASSQGKSDSDCGYDSDKENIPPSDENGGQSSSSTAGNRVIRLNEGPLPSKVLVPRELLASFQDQFVDIRDKLQAVVAKHKKDKDATRKRYERARKKLVNEINDLKLIVLDRDAVVTQLGLALRENESCAEKLRTQLAAARTELVNAKMGGVPVTLN